MDEEIVLRLLRNVIERILADADADADVDTAGSAREKATNIAEAAWNALLVLLRESLATGGSVILSDIGRFVSSDGNWKFEPAAALVEAASLRRSQELGYGDIVKRVIFYLNESAELLGDLPTQIKVAASAVQTAEERILLPAGLGHVFLSDAVDDYADRFRRQAAYLRGEGRPAEPSAFSQLFRALRVAYPQKEKKTTDAGFVDLRPEDIERESEQAKATEPDTLIDFHEDDKERSE